MTEQNSEINRLRWKCRRGMRELDTLLLSYLQNSYVTASKNQKLAFQKVLAMQDPELYFLVLGKTSSDNQDINHVVTALQNALRA